MTQPTDKQINYASSLGIEGASNMSKEDLSKAIDAKVGGKPTAKPQATQAVVTPTHSVVVARTEKPHSYEFGKAGARHKIYYSTIEDLREMYNSLKEAGFIQLEDEIEHQKI